jgi:hypothetical protein
MKGTRGGDFVRTPASDGELDRGSASRCPRSVMRGANAPLLPAYAHARAALRRGLDGVLLTVLAGQQSRLCEASSSST